MTRYQHIMELADELDTHVYIHFSKDDYGWAFPDPRKVYRWTAKERKIANINETPEWGHRIIVTSNPAKRVKGYWTALHELGHVALRHTNARYKRSYMGCEIAAWQWAVDNSIHPLSHHVLADMRYALEKHPYNFDRKANQPRIDKWIQRQKEAL